MNFIVVCSGFQWFQVFFFFFWGGGAALAQCDDVLAQLDLIWFKSSLRADFGHLWLDMVTHTCFGSSNYTYQPRTHTKWIGTPKTCISCLHSAPHEVCLDQRSCIRRAALEGR